MARLEFVGREELEGLNALEAWAAEDPAFRVYEIRRRHPTTRDRIPLAWVVVLHSNRSRDWNQYKGQGDHLRGAVRAALESYPKARPKFRKRSRGR